MSRNRLNNIIIAGGAKEVNKFAMSSFDALGVFSPDETTPTAACRPFDSTRNGLIPSGGGATLIIESYASAKKRGAPIIAEILGYGFSSNGGHISTPNIVGPATAMRKALEQAKVDPKDVDYINAHATSTPIGDANEADRKSVV